MEENKKDIFTNLKDNWLKTVKTTSFSKQPKEISFLNAINKNDYNKVAELIKGGISPNLKHSGDTALNIAISKNSIDVVRTLIKNGADINNPSEKQDGNRAIDNAIAYNRPEIISILIQNNVSINAKNSKKTLIQEAIEKGRTEALNILLNAGLDPYKNIEHGQTPIISAIRYNRLQSFEILLKHKNIIQNMHKEFWEDEKLPLLHFAIIRGNNTIASSLIDIGCNINKKDKSGKTPLHHAIIHSNYEMVKTLIENGADINKQHDVKGNYPIHYLANTMNWERMLPILLEEKVNINKQNNDKETPLIIALKNNRFDLVKILLENGADPNIKDKDGNSPLLISASKNSYMIDVFTNNKNTNLNTRSEQTGETILYSIIRRRDYDLFDKLIDKGARIDIVNYNEKSPLRIARELNDKIMISKMEKILLKKQSNFQYKR